MLNSESSATTFRPILFLASESDGRRRLEDLRRSEVALFEYDTLREQLDELALTLHPNQEEGDTAWLEARRLEILNGCPVDEYGVWAFYPWSKRLVRLLPQPAFRQLRTDRNRYKIGADEQQRLSEATIGIVGLSVGYSAALTLATEGVGGHFRLADFDRLSLSNLNRLPAGVHQLGINKAVLAARRMFEIDPFLDIQIFSDGITPETMDPFLLEGGRLDLLVEECDDLYVKVRIRERCRELLVPVMMDTSDRGLFDIERFDLEPERPLFHGLVGNLDADTLRGLSAMDKVPYVLSILGNESMSPRLRASLLEVKESIYTWPQLASAVTLGGAIVTDTARRVLLGGSRDSGRFYVDLDAIISDGRAESPSMAQVVGSASAPSDHDIMSRLTAPPDRSRSDHITVQQARWLVDAATRAPSGGNAQPWQFVLRHGELEFRVRPQLRASFFDFDGRATHVAIGAAAENVAIAATHLGLATISSPSLEVHRDGRPIATQRFVAGGIRPDPLFSVIDRRYTDRHLAVRETLPIASQAALIAAAAERGAKLKIVESSASLDTIADLLAEADRLSFLDPQMHSDMMAEFRWTPEEARTTRDGIDVSTLALSASDRAGLAIIAQPQTMRELATLGAGRGLGRLSRKWIRAASAVALLTMPNPTEATYFQGGRALQRVWLTATKLGLGLHPMTVLPYLFARMSEGGVGLTPVQVSHLRPLREKYARVFALPNNEPEVLLFRIVTARTPAAWSLRLPVEDVFTVA